MGNGAAIRELYRDDSLESHFYTRFDERTAGAHPCVFLFWNGVDFERLYAGNRDPFFPVGADLLLLDRPAGAAHAFRRGLAAGEERADNLYWLGWALRWSGRAADARAAWRDAGQVDDRALAEERYAAARTALARGDSTVARRSLLASVLAGIGRADAHAALGELLAGRAPKFALLETRVATRLAPGDWRVRRTLVAGLVAARLDDAARSELRTLRETEPGWRSDPVVAALERALGGREDDTRATGHAAAGATGAPHGIVHPSQGQGDTP
jgi:tetratricopeptide (TPR) repeat protein